MLSVEAATAFRIQECELDQTKGVKNAMPGFCISEASTTIGVNIGGHAADARRPKPQLGTHPRTHTLLSSLRDPRIHDSSKVDHMLA